MKETIFEQQLKISKLGCQDVYNPSSLPTTTAVNKRDSIGGSNAVDVTTRIATAEERAEQMMMREIEAAERGARNHIDKAAREGTIRRVERWAASIAEQETREREETEIRALSSLSPLFTSIID